MEESAQFHVLQLPYPGVIHGFDRVWSNLQAILEGYCEKVPDGRKWRRLRQRASSVGTIQIRSGRNGVHRFLHRPLHCSHVARVNVPDAQRREDGSQQTGPSRTPGGRDGAHDHQAPLAHHNHRPLQGGNHSIRGYVVSMDERFCRVDSVRFFHHVCRVGDARCEFLLRAQEGSSGKFCEHHKGNGSEDIHGASCIGEYCERNREEIRHDGEQNNGQCPQVVEPS
mmetsp:Transcript_31939/g.54486  ORF Transcript_31939/g.54486 Transcript_31939/m.54486 type:complete len:225 (-) Transcript_31939:1130-1804(-)